MKTLGVIGGMSWESTLHYYRQLNEGVRDRLGGLHSAELRLWSVDFAPIEQLQARGDWDQAGRLLAEAGRGLTQLGCDGLLIATNTMHLVADQVSRATDRPLLHIADCTGEALVRDGLERVALLGTAFTMEKGFYKDRLRDRFGLTVLTPDKAQRDAVHRIIYQELCLGRVNDHSRRVYLDIVRDLTLKGAQAVILGCTEIGLLIQPGHTTIPLYDTVDIHARSAVDWMLRDT